MQMEGDAVSGLLSAARLADVIVATLPEPGRNGTGDPLRIVADLTLDREMLQDVVRRKL